MVRHVTAVRPLSLKNSDNKTVAGVYNHCAAPVVARCACQIQNGFVLGRQLLQNIVNLDTFARAVTFGDASMFLPILMFFDFAAAFPSVLHRWLFKVIEKQGMPEGMRNVVKALYSNCKAFMRTPSGLHFLFVILSGVLQGCPFSGTLFVLVLDPFLRRIHSLVDCRGLGITRACADDIGMVLKNWIH